jgi:hypothetical protein
MRVLSAHGENLPVLSLRQIGSDIACAFVVLALVFLSFAHTPVSAAAPHDVLTAAVDQSWCGDAPDSDGKAHAPCHACRLGAAADQPPPCDFALPARLVATVAYGALPVLHLPAKPLTQYAARGPPQA